MATFDDLAPGLSADAAIEAFLDGCNKPDRQNISSFRRRQVIPQLRALLPDPIDAPAAAALLDVVYRRRTLNQVMNWLARQPTTWDEYERELRREAAGRDYERMREGIFPWPDVEACRGEGARSALGRLPRPSAEGIAAHGDGARPCPVCGTRGADLTWVDFTSAPVTWENLCGRAGWLTVCETCGLQIDFFCEVLN